jgi:uncharacterized DUF497 family protein
MRFVWDEKKNRRNLAKHKISFETTKLVFEDPFAISRLDRIVDGEERWQTMGLIGAVVVVLETHPASLFFAISRPRSPLFSMSSFARNGLSG